MSKKIWIEVRPSRPFTVLWSEKEIKRESERGGRER